MSLKKNQLTLHKSFSLLAILSLAYIPQSFAKEYESYITGYGTYIQGIYSSPFNSGAEGGEEGNVTEELKDGGFSVVPTLTVHYEMFDSTKTSYLLSTDLAIDFETGKVMYNYFGVGRNFFYKGQLVKIDTSSPEAKDSIKITSFRSYYWGWDAGLSRVAVVSFGPALSAVSTGVDFGGHWGITQRLSDKMSMRFQSGMSLAYGISTVSATGMNFKFSFGISYKL